VHKNWFCSDEGGKRVWELDKSSLEACAAKCNASACECFDFREDKTDGGSSRGDKTGKCRGVTVVTLKRSHSDEEAFVRQTDTNSAYELDFSGAGDSPIKSSSENSDADHKVLKSDDDAAAKLVGSWSFEDVTTPGAVPNAQHGGKAGAYDTRSARVVALGVGNISVLRMFGNASHGFVVPKDAKIDGSRPLSLAMWLNWFWGDPVLVQQAGFLLELYRQFIKTEYYAAGLEWTPYPMQCSYISPGRWHHLAMAWGPRGASLFVDGQLCTKSRSRSTHVGDSSSGPVGWTAHKDTFCSDQGGSRIFEKSKLSLEDCAKMAAQAKCACFDYVSHSGGKCRGTDVVVLKHSSSGETAFTKSGPSPSPGPPAPPAPPGPAPSLPKGDIRVGGWSGLLSDVRIYSGEIEAAAVTSLYSSTATYYNSTAVQLPSAQAIREANRSWSLEQIAITDSERSMYDAWLQRNITARLTRSRAHPFRHLIWSPTEPESPLSSAIRELENSFGLQAVAASTIPWATLSASLIVGTCDEQHIRLALAGRACTVIGEPESFFVRSLGSASQAEDGGGTSVMLVGGGAPGVLYGSFALDRRLKLARSWDDVEELERPSTAVRMVNHWVQWRGASLADAWCERRAAAQTGTQLAPLKT
jgi:hypothetical protein